MIHLVRSAAPVPQTISLSSLLSDIARISLSVHHITRHTVAPSCVDLDNALFLLGSLASRHIIPRVELHDHMFSGKL